MGIDLYTLASEMPDVVIQVKANDLIEAARMFAKDLAFSSNEPIVKEEIMDDTLFKLDEVKEMLGVSETTLWRWDTKYDYLHPVMVGAQRRWRWKDIAAIIDGNVKNSYGNPVWTPGNKEATIKAKR